MRTVIILLVAMVWLSISGGSVLAHTLKIDGSIGVTMHIEPDDEPLASEPSRIFIDITNRLGQFNPAQCDCTLIVNKGPDTLLKTSIIVGGNYTPLSFTFPESGAYSLTVDGKPTAGASFQTFQTKFSYYVKSWEGTSLYLGVERNPLRNYVPYAVFTVGLLIAILWLSNSPEKKGSHA